MLDLVKVANVLDAAADCLDAAEHEKLSAAHSARTAQINALADKYAEATGEEMPDAIRQKLAHSDKDVVELLQSMVTKQAGHPEALGGPSNEDDDAPLTKKEAADAADDRFLNWITS